MYEHETEQTATHTKPIAGMDQTNTMGQAKSFRIHCPRENPCIHNIFEGEPCKGKNILHRTSVYTYKDNITWKLFYLFLAALPTPLLGLATHYLPTGGTGTGGSGGGGGGFWTGG